MGLEKYRIISNIGTIEEIISSSKLRGFLHLPQKPKVTPMLWCELLLVQDFPRNPEGHIGLARGYQSTHLMHAPGTVSPTFTFYLNEKQELDLIKDSRENHILLIGNAKYRINPKDARKPLTCESKQFSDFEEIWKYMRTLV